jgi:NAD(P)-dependent dehydrogenase (short-subunit alcohol dehydrogenase family)
MTGLNGFRLDGQVALVTGGAGHLGAAMTRALCQAGATVLVNGRTESTVRVLVDEMKDSGFQAEPAVFDLTVESQGADLIRQTESRHGKLDILINNAHHGKPGNVLTDTPENFEAAYRLCVSMPFRLIQLALPLLKQSAATRAGGASIVNIASMYGVVSPNPEIYRAQGNYNPPHYGPAKAGLLQLTRYLACHLAPFKIRVNSLSPGPFPRPETVQANPEFHQALCSKVPLQRVGEPGELAGAVLFLASPAASYITGANLPVDGGWTAW